MLFLAIAYDEHVDFSSLKPSLASTIFDTMISPILTYNSEVWGVYTKSDFKSWENSPIEKTHLQFCKRYLEVSNKASNIACRAELNINKRMLNYVTYLRNTDQDCSIVKQSLLTSIVLHSQGKLSSFLFQSHKHLPLL